MAFFKGGDGQDRLKMLYLLGKKYYDYGKPKSNFNATFSRKFMLDEKEYEFKKQRDINDFLQSGGKSRLVMDKARHSRDLYVKWLLANTQLTQQQVADIGDLSTKTIYTITKQLFF